MAEKEARLVTEGGHIGGGLMKMTYLSWQNFTLPSGRVSIAQVGRSVACDPHVSIFKVDSMILPWARWRTN